MNFSYEMVRLQQRLREMARGHIACVCIAKVDTNEEERVSAKHPKKSSLAIPDHSHSRHFKHRDDSPYIILIDPVAYLLNCLSS